MMESRGTGEAETGYFYVKGQRVPLDRDPEVFAVRLRAGVKDDSEVLSLRARRTLRDESEPVAIIANYGLKIYRRTGSPAERTVRGEGAAVADAIATSRMLDEEPAVDLAATAFRRNVGSDELMFTTRRFIVQFRPDVRRDTVDALNAQHGVVLVEATRYMINGFVLMAPSGEGPAGPVALANAYFESGLALSATPDFVRRIHIRNAIATPERADSAMAARLATAERGDYLTAQWHLPLAKVTDAWAVTTGDPGIVVAVLDDGIDVDHAEFAGKVTKQYDFASRSADARPKIASDNHGTACAGVAVASGVRAHGAAPKCSLLAVKTPDYLGVAEEAEMFRWVTDEGADVISCSWGPTDGTGTTDPLPDNVREAIRYCVTSGRAGRGIPIVWAAGNGNESVSLDGYASNPDVMAIGASTSRETRAPYSDFGPEVWIVAPSSGSSAAGDQRVFTTDRTGAAGYNTGSAAAGDAAGDYTNNFGGTSSATPLVAGVIGLMLSANGALTHLQVRDILRQTAEKIGGAAAYDASGHSPQFGFGRVDAKRAVDESRVRAGGGGGGGTVSAAGRPSITGPSERRRSESAPTFNVNSQGNPLYAVEVATRWQLLDGGHDSERTADTFYGSWQDQSLQSAPTWALPTPVWDRLKAADRLVYRVHSAQDASWNGWQVSTPDDEAASAPSIEIRSGSSATPAATSGRPTIIGPSSTDRDGIPPAFEIGLAGNQLYAVEVAIRAELFDGAHDSERTVDTFYGSWQDTSLMSDPTYRLSDAGWSHLRTAARLFYRVHTAQDTSWNGWQVSTPDAEALSAPSMMVAAGGGGGGGGSTSAPRTVTYPLTSFVEATAPNDGIDYADRVAGGAVALIEVRNRGEDRLSANFQVKEFTARRLDRPAEKAAYARLSPDLVEGLQGMREAIGSSISIVSGYRYPALNDDVDGAGQSQHMAGRAADIKSSTRTPLELARTAIDVLGRNIGLGLGKNSLHVDVRGEPGSWVYTGAALSEADFDAWVRRTATELGRSDDGARLDAATRLRPSIVGPTTVEGDDVPAFSIEPAGFGWFGVEVAEDPQVLAGAPELLRGDPPGTFASWRRAGLTPAGDAAVVSYVLPAEAWARLRSASRLFYRVVCSDSPDVVGEIVTSTMYDAPEEFPSFQVGTAHRARSAEESPIDLSASRDADQARWREPDLADASSRQDGASGAAPAGAGASVGRAGSPPGSRNRKVV